MHTVLTQNAESPHRRWLGIFVGENEIQKYIGSMLYKKQTAIKIFCVYFSTIALALIISPRLSAAAVSWDNYRKPFSQTLKVPLFGGIKVAVALPADFMMNRETIALNFDIESNFYFRTDGLEQKGFEGFTPKVSVNGGIIFGNYNISVKELPARQILKIRIKNQIPENR